MENILGNNNLFKTFVWIKTEMFPQKIAKSITYTLLNNPKKQCAVHCKYTCLICNYYVLDICIHLSRAKTYLDGGQLITDA